MYCVYTKEVRSSEKMLQCQWFQDDTDTFVNGISMIDIIQINTLGYLFSHISGMGIEEIWSEINCKKY